MAVFGTGPVILVETAVEPPLREAERLGGVFARGVARGAFVEGHHNVGSDRALGVDDAFGREEVLRAVDVRPEMASLLFQLAARGQRKDLKAAAVGEHRAFPGREAVHAAGAFEDLRAGAQVEVIGVCQDDLRAGFVAHVAVENALHRRGRAHGHEDRGADDAVIRMQFARAGVRRRVFMLQGEFHTHIFGKNTQNISIFAHISSICNSSNKFCHAMAGRVRPSRGRRS